MALQHNAYIQDLKVSKTEGYEINRFINVDTMDYVWHVRHWTWPNRGVKKYGDAEGPFNSLEDVQAWCRMHHMTGA